MVASQLRPSPADNIESGIYIIAKHPQVYDARKPALMACCQKSMPPSQKEQAF